MEQGGPAVAIGGPAAEVLHTGEGSGSHALVQGRIVGKALHAVCEGGRIANRNDKTFDAVGEQVFSPGGGGAEHGATTGHGLRLHEGEAFFDAGQDEQVATAHPAGEFGLG